jgi:hypothetical protein
MWLHENGLENIRILSFGYDANWGNIMAPKNALGIADFAIQLLDALDLHYTQRGDVFCFVNIDMLIFRHSPFLWHIVWED